MRGRKTVARSRGPRHGADRSFDSNRNQPRRSSIVPVLRTRQPLRQRPEAIARMNWAELVATEVAWERQSPDWRVAPTPIGRLAFPGFGPRSHAFRDNCGLELGSSPLCSRDAQDSPGVVKGKSYPRRAQWQCWKDARTSRKSRKCNQAQTAARNV